jgi:hypothetical protein
MLAPPEVPRNAERREAKAALSEDESVQRGQGQYKGRSPQDPDPARRERHLPSPECPPPPA